MTASSMLSSAGSMVLHASPVLVVFVVLFMLFVMAVVLIIGGIITAIVIPIAIIIAIVIIPATARGKQDKKSK
jgi:hypothetical protein